MSEEVANKLLRANVAQLLLPVGWHNITNTSVQVLVDVMRRYIEGVGKITSGYAEHGNRCLCNLDDLALAFDDYQITLPSLQDYLLDVDQVPFPHEVFPFPVKQCQNKHVYESSTPPITTSTTLIGENSDDDEDDEVLSPLIPPYLPPLPTKEETDKADEEDDRESGIHISDVEEMELGGVPEGNTPVDGQTPKGLPGMASAGRRERTFSTDSDVSSEHDDQTLSKHSPADVAKQQSAVMPTRVVPHRINPIRLSEAASPDPIVTPHDDEVSVSGMSLDDSSLESDEEIEVEDKVQPVSKKRKTKGETITEDEASLQGSTDVIPEKKSSKKQQKSPSTPSARIIAKSETKEATSGPYKPTVSSKLLTRFTLAKDTAPPKTATPEKEEDRQKLPQAGRLPEPPPPLNLKSVPRESKVSLSSLSPLSSDISSPRSPLGNKNMQLTLEKFPMESPTKRSYKLDSLSPTLSPTSQYSLSAAVASFKDETVPLMSPTVTTNSEDEDSDVSALSPKIPVSIKKENKPTTKALAKSSDASFITGPGDKSKTHKGTTPKTVAMTGKEKLMVSINRKYINLPKRDIKLPPASHKKKSKAAAVSEGSRCLMISIAKQHYFHAMASRQKPKRPQTLAPATVKQDRKTKVKSALAEDRAQPVGTREVDTMPRPPAIVTPAETPLSQPLKLRFKLNSDVVGESSISPAIKDTLAPPPPEWPSGGHSLHKKKKKHKKEKKKKKKKYHDSDSSSDSDGIYSEGNSAKNSPMPTSHKTTTSHILPPLATTVLPYQPAYPLAICPSCKLPDDGRPMIACDICDRWFHWLCVNVVTAPLDGMDWYCPECSRDSNTGNGSSKRKEHKHKKKKKHYHDHD